MMNTRDAEILNAWRWAVGVAAQGQIARVFAVILTVLAVVSLSFPGLSQESGGVPSIEQDMGIFTNGDGDRLFLGTSSYGRPYYMLGDYLVPLTEQESGLLVSEDGTELAITRGEDASFEAIEVRTPNGEHTIYDYTNIYEVHETRVESGPVQLRCSYIEPLVPGPHPAVVFAHGSGPNLRSRYMYTMWKFAVAGIASFACDKRGSGESGGDLFLAGFDDLSDDLISSVRYVASSYEIDPDRLGVIGISQAGWVMPIAASKESLIKFVISVSGSGVPLAMQEHYLIENNLRYAGLGSMASQLAHQMIHVINSGSSILQAEKLNAMGLTAPKIDKYFDPATVWPRLTQPVLAIFGSHDRHVPPGSSSQILSEAVMGRPSLGSKVLVLRAANHGMLMSKSGFAAEPVPSKRAFAPGYFSAMTTWIENSFRLDGAIPGQLDQAEILALAEAETIISPYASVTSHFLTKAALLVLIILATITSVGIKPLLRLVNRGKYKEPLSQSEKKVWRRLNSVSLLNFFMALLVVVAGIVVLSFSAPNPGVIATAVILMPLIALISSVWSVYTVFRCVVGPQRAHTFSSHGILASIVILGITAFPLFSLSWFIG